MQVSSVLSCQDGPHLVLTDGVSYTVTLLAA